MLLLMDKRRVHRREQYLGAASFPIPNPIPDRSARGGWVWLHLQFRAPEPLTIKVSATQFGQLRSRALGGIGRGGGGGGGWARVRYDDVPESLAPFSTRSLR